MRNVRNSQRPVLYWAYVLALDPEPPRCLVNAYFAELIYHYLDDTKEDQPTTLGVSKYNNVQIKIRPGSLSV